MTTQPNRRFRYRGGAVVALAMTALVVPTVAGAQATPGSGTTQHRTSSSAAACAGDRTASASASTATASPAGAPTSTVRLPRDEAAHHSPTEWWYFSGHLRGVDAAGQTHCYGYEYVTFQFLGDGPSPVYIGNLSITDLSAHSFHYTAIPDSYPVPTTRDGFNIHTGSWSMMGGSGRVTLRASLPGYQFHLRLRTTKPAVLHGHDGTIAFGPFGTSKYYSWTSLQTTGTLIDHGTPVRVGGISWMDHQWGAINFASGGGWDWFSVQLTDGRQYMLYFIRDSAGDIVAANGTRIGPAGRATHLTRSQIRVHTRHTWTSPVTGITYGSGWRVRVPGGHLSVKPDLLDQELDLRQIQGVAYWEGDVSVQGRINGARVAGVGYTEINPPGQP